MDTKVIPFNKIKKAFDEVYEVYRFIMRFFKEAF